LRRIDAHAHYLPQALIEALERREQAPRLISSPDGRLVDCGAGLIYPLFDELTDLAAQLERMDRDAIETAILGAVPPGVDGLGTDAAAVARACNDELAEIVRESGGRFAAVAVVAAGEPEAAAEELDRARSLGISGGQLFSNVEGEALDGPRFEPIFDRAGGLGMPLVLHPTRPRAERGLEEFGLMTTFGFIFDTAVCATRLVLAGLFDRQPELKLLLPHVGSLIPYQLARIDHELAMLRPDDVKLSASPSEHLRRLYLDSVCLWPPALRLALEVFGADHVLFGTDEPFWSGSEGIETLEALGLEPEQQRAVERGNAERVFSLNGQPG
jgi:aminocarboxymuconate-semialdehyde decarboxylase